MPASGNEVLFPRFYRKFSCIGSSCENNCCHNWCISIDQKTWQAYTSHPDKQLTDLVHNSTHAPENPTEMDYRRMTMSDDGLCPAYRKEDGLCDIHDRLGEELLSETCQTYPRRMTKALHKLEPSLSISCPEAARHILLDPHSMDMQPDNLIATDFTPTTTRSSQADYFDEFRTTAMEVVSEVDISPDEMLHRLGVLFNFVSTSQQADEDPGHIFSAFKVMQDKGVFARMYHNLPVGLAIQTEVLKHLLMAPSFWKINHVLADYHQQFVDILNRDYAINGHVDLHRLISTSYQNRFKQMAAINSSAFSNYFKHWLYSSDVCNLTGTELLNRYAGFILQYSIVRSYISILTDGKNDKEIMVGIIHSLSRGFDHHPPFLEKLLAYLGNSGLGNPIQMMGLLKIEASKASAKDSTPINPIQLQS